MLFVAPRAVGTVLDDRHGVLGLRGSGFNSIRMERARSPTHLTREASRKRMQRHFSGRGDVPDPCGPEHGRPLTRRVGRDRLGLPSGHLSLIR
ncbi:hypothetical protein [Streptomyces sp. bgisy027]|uniref:hypothetical protein n=1 Tax=Streptomyces sp. bgisy027 TaxID=3413770 RepID=UPI003D729D35